jgi:aminoglycoside phosphotransferase (APT) family kinase protein
MPRLPLDRELAAVRTLTGGLGLAGAEPVVLKLAKHTTLRLGELVARVQSAGDLEAARAVMAQEVAVAQHLARGGAPAVRPSVDPPPGPHEVGGCVISLWSFVEHHAADEADAAAGPALKEVHAALASYEGALPAYVETVRACAALAKDAVAMAAAAPDDRAFLANLVRAGLARAPSDEAAWIVLHGDAHLGNALVTPAGVIWADLEAVCRGPLEWDLANQPAAFLASFDGLDRTLLDQLGALRRACVAVWCWADAGRSAETRAAAAYHTAQLRREAAASRFA